MQLSLLLLVAIGAVLLAIVVASAYTSRTAH